MSRALIVLFLMAIGWWVQAHPRPWQSANIEDVRASEQGLLFREAIESRYSVEFMPVFYYPIMWSPIVNSGYLDALLIWEQELKYHERRR